MFFNICLNQILYWFKIRKQYVTSFKFRCFFYEILNYLYIVNTQKYIYNFQTIEWIDYFIFHYLYWQYLRNFVIHKTYIFYIQYGWISRNFCFIESFQNYISTPLFQFAIILIELYDCMVMFFRNDFFLGKPL